MRPNENIDEGYRYPGAFDLNQCELSTTTSVIDLKDDGAPDFTIYQNMFEHYMAIDLVVNDAQGLGSQIISQDDTVGGYNGVAKLTMEIEVPTQDPIILEFGVYEVTDRNRIKENQDVYILRGISIEAFRNAPRKVSRAFGKGSGNTIDNMVQGIYKEFFKSDKPITVDPTKGNHRFIIPNLSVDDTIEFFINESDSNSRGNFFSFYENFNGFHFKDFNLIVTQQPTKEFVYLPSNIDGADNKESQDFIDSRTITTFKVRKHTNYFENVKKGMYKSKSINVDLLRKKKTQVVFDYLNNYTQFKTIGTKRYPSFEEHEDAVIFLQTTRRSHDGDSVLLSEEHVPKKIDQFKQFRRSYITHMYNNVIDVTVPGDTDVNVGDVVRLSINMATTNPDYDGEEDKYLSGNYVVTKVAHSFTETKFDTKIECVRDAGDEI